MNTSDNLIKDFQNNTALQAHIKSSLDIFSTICAVFARDRGFADEHEQISSLLNAEEAFDLVQWFEDTALQAEIGRIMSEGGEAIEAVRKPKADEHLPEFDNLIIELADILIRVGDCAGRRGMPLGEATVAKLLYNLSRPYKHGKSS